MQPNEMKPNYFIKHKYDEKKGKFEKKMSE